MAHGRAPRPPRGGREHGGTLLKVAATGDATPAGGMFSTFLSATNYATVPLVADNQQVAFRGSLNTMKAIWGHMSPER